MTSGTLSGAMRIRTCSVTRISHRFHTIQTTHSLYTPTASMHETDLP